MIDTKETDRIRKIDALTKSVSKGEAASAKSRLNAILKKHGKTKADLPALLGDRSTDLDQEPQSEKAPARPSPTFADIFAHMDDEIEKRHPGHKAERAAQGEKQAADKIALREALIAQYGSKDAAMAPNAMEQAIDEAVKPFMQKQMKHFMNGDFMTETLEGYSGFLDKVSDRVAAAVRAALPLPTTIAEAKAEYDAWRMRDDELIAIEDRGADTCLSLGCSIREKIVRDMLYHEIRAVSIEDAIVRHRVLSETGTYPSEQEWSAMLADLVFLAEKQPAAAQSKAASQKRQAKSERQPKGRQANTAQTELGF